MHQESILAALLASAIAESASHGFAGTFAVEQLSETFDQGGKDMIDLEHVICDLSPLDISLGVYPLGQLALAIYTISVSLGRSQRRGRCHGSVFHSQRCLQPPARTQAMEQRVPRSPRHTLGLQHSRLSKVSGTET